MYIFQKAHGALTYLPLLASKAVKVGTALKMSASGGLDLCGATDKPRYISNIETTGDGSLIPVSEITEDTVLIAPGTTTLEIASQLRQRVELTVITNSLPVAMELAGCPGISVFCLGGHLRGDDFSTSGITAMQNLNLFNANKLIIGIGGITPQRGLTDYRMDESALLRIFVEKADCVIGIADHSKFGVTAMYNICPANRLNHLITDSGTPEELYKPFSDMGVHVHIVNTEADTM